MALSVEAGRPVECERAATFADGMAVRVAIPLAVDEIRRLGPVPMAMVSERAIAWAVADYARAGIRAEGAAAAALAAFRQLPVEPDDPTVVIVTGRNIDDEVYRRAVENPDSFPD